MSVHGGIDPEHFRQAVCSVLNQSYGRVALYLMLDGQQTESVQLILAGIDDRRLTVVSSQHNRGLAESLNALLERALPRNHRYVARMDADDVSLPERFAAQLSYLQSHEEIGVLGTACIEVDEGGRRIGIVRKPETHAELRALVSTGNPFIHPSVMFRASVFTDGTRYPTRFRLAEDIGLWVSLLEKGVQFANLSEPLLLFRRTRATVGRRRGIGNAWPETYHRLRSLRIPGQFSAGRMGMIGAMFLTRLLPVPALEVCYRLQRGALSRLYRRLAAG
ncbi:MAG: glycosyltransferase [Acidobacteriota bacterium]